MTIPNPKNLFSIVHLTQKKSLISTVLYHYFRQKWRRYHKNVISALLGLCEKHWTVRHYHYELYPSRIFSENLFPLAYPTQKNSLNFIFTVPQFSKSDKKCRRYRGGVTYWGSADLDISIRWNATIHEKMPPGGSHIGKSATPWLLSLCPNVLIGL